MNGNMLTRHTSWIAALVFLLALLPLSGLATQVDVPAFGVTLRFPASLDVFTRDMAPDDPVLTLYGQTAEQVSQTLRAAGLYADALDIAGEYTVSLAIQGGGGPDFSQMDFDALARVAAEHGGGRHELVPGSQGNFLMVYEDSGKGLTCLYQAEGLYLSLRLFAGNGVEHEMETLLSDIARRAEFSLYQ